MNNNATKIISLFEGYEKTSRKIADMYLKRFPRKYSCDVIVGPSELLLASFLFEVSDDDIAILNECMQDVYSDSAAHGKGKTLEAVLKEKGHTDLLNRLRSCLASGEPKRVTETMSRRCSREMKPYIDSVFLDEIKKYATFRYTECRDDDATNYDQMIELPLTDGEFRQILTKCLTCASRYTMNKLIGDMAMHSQRLMQTAIAETCGYTDNNAYPFILDMVEIKDVAARILDPFEDLLGLFGSEDEDIKAFLEAHQCIGGGSRSCDFEAVDEEDGRTRFVMTARFVGTDIEFADSYKKEAERFTVSAFDVMKRFSLDAPRGIFPFVRRYYNKTGGFSDLRKDLME